MLVIRLFALIASMKLARRWKRGLTMTDHTENQKLWELDSLIHGKDKAERYWEHKIPLTNIWIDMGGAPVAFWLEGFEYRRKSDAPKLPDGDCVPCDWSGKFNVCEKCCAVYPNRVIRDKPNPEPSFVLCCDCTYEPEFEEITDVLLCEKDTGVNIYGRTRSIQGCTEGTPKPKMRSINGMEFPEPKKVQSGMCGYPTVQISLYGPNGWIKSESHEWETDEDSEAAYNSIVSAIGGEEI
jgi:hypothetical protein